MCKVSYVPLCWVLAAKCHSGESHHEWERQLWSVHLEHECNEGNSRRGLAAALWPSILPRVAEHARPHSRGQHTARGALGEHPWEKSAFQPKYICVCNFIKNLIFWGKQWLMFSFSFLFLFRNYQLNINDIPIQCQVLK